MKTIFATIISLIVSLSLQAQDAPQRKTIDLPNGRAADIPAGPFEASWESLRKNYRTPQWFVDGKFGIFIHWGVYSVPASGSEWYPRHMYGAMLDEHTKKWGSPKDFGYKDFIPLFKAEKFGYVEGLRLQSAEAIVRSLVNNISRNGNLCLNISPKSDGTIPEDQQAVLRAIGKWLRTNGEGVYCSKSLDDVNADDEKAGLRFTQKGSNIYVFVLRPKNKELDIKTVKTLAGRKIKSVTLLGEDQDLAFPLVFRIELSPMRILYIGDSITDGGWGRSGGSMKSSDERNHNDLNHIYGHGYMEMSAATLMAENPGRYECLNRGISGNTLTDLETRWQKDCLDLQPDIISILIGTNDVEEFLNSGKNKFDLKAWENRYDKLIEKTKQSLHNVRLMLGTPFVAKVGKRGAAENFAQRDSLIRELAATIERLVKKHNTTLVPFAQMIDELTTRTEAPASYWIWDGIHPTSALHKKMADLWLESYKSK